MTILTIALIVRKDWSKKLLLPVGALSLTLIICTPLGITQSLYLPASTKISAATSVPITPTQERISAYERNKQIYDEVVSEVRKQIRPNYTPFC
jgi:hypothetical protein